MPPRRIEAIAWRESWPLPPSNLIRELRPAAGALEFEANRFDVGVVTEHVDCFNLGNWLGWR